MINFTQKVRAELRFMDFVPVIYISAKTGQRVHTVLPAALEVSAARRHRLGTSELNQLVRDAYEAITPPRKTGNPLRIYYVTQIRVSPPTFLFFVNDPDLVHFSYERYLENKIRDHYPFPGTPLRLIFRKRSGNARDTSSTA
jgi:GTP-binding protein